jgi:hypothetical protein
VTQDGSPSGLPSAAAIAVAGGLIVVLVAGFIVLSLAGRDTGTYVLFVAGPLVTSVVGAVLARQGAATKRLAETAVEQTNGKMSAEFVDVHDHLDGQTGLLLASLVDGPPAAVPARYKNSSSAPGTMPLPEQGAPRIGPDQTVHR